MIDRNEQTFMIGLDGGLRRIPAYMASDMQKKGWLLVVNPKRLYYPEHDQTLDSYRKQADPNIELETLEVEVL